jgi:hypothetical protein
MPFGDDPSEVVLALVGVAISIYGAMQFAPVVDKVKKTLAYLEDNTKNVVKAIDKGAEVVIEGAQAVGDAAVGLSRTEVGSSAIKVVKTGIELAVNPIATSERAAESFFDYFTIKAGYEGRHFTTLSMSRDIRKLQPPETQSIVSLYFDERQSVAFYESTTKDFELNVIVNQRTTDNIVRLTQKEIESMHGRFEKIDTISPLVIGWTWTLVEGTIPLFVQTAIGVLGGAISPFSYVGGDYFGDLPDGLAGEIMATPERGAQAVLQYMESRYDIGEMEAYVSQELMSLGKVPDVLVSAIEKVPAFAGKLMINGWSIWRQFRYRKSVGGAVQLGNAGKFTQFMVTTGAGVVVGYITQWMGIQITTFLEGQWGNVAGVVNQIAGAPIMAATVEESKHPDAWHTVITVASDFVPLLMISLFAKMVGRTGRGRV